MSTLVYLAVTVLLVLANGFFVAAEFALVKVRPTRLEELVRQGNSRATLALRMTRKLGAYLSANQLGITLASLALGWIGEPAIAHLIEPLLAGLGPLASSSSRAISLGIALFVVTGLHTVFGELAPKAIAIERAEAVALNCALPLHAFYVVMWPVIRTLDAAGNAVARMLGVGPGGARDLAHTSEELRMLLVQHPVGLDPSVRSVLVRMLDQRRRTARHVMTLRSDAITLRADTTIDDAVRIADDAGYSRYPVLDEDEQHVLGYVHLRDLFSVLSGRRKAERVAELVRKPLFTREHRSVERLRLEMQAQKTPVAVVVSRTNEFLGLITIEDLLEEIVGEIRDETDEEVPPIHRRGGGIVDVDGRVFVSDLERDAGIRLEPHVEGAETLGGYILARLGRPAETGERVECEGYALVAIDVAGRRVRRVRVVPSAPRSEEGDPSGGSA